VQPLFLNLFATTSRFLSVRHIEHTSRVAGGDDFVWEFADPSKLMALVLNANTALQALYTQALQERPSTPDQPWSVVLGFDEFTPGDKLKVDNRRKAMVLSFTFRELGQTAMTNGHAWFTPVVIRANMLHEIEGGWSRCLKVFIRRLLFATDGGLATSGVTVVLDGRPTIIFGKITNLISDGQGLMLAYGWKGHGGFKPCLKHHNVFKKDSSPRVTQLHSARAPTLECRCGMATLPAATCLTLEVLC
jgi:hypothetical protein